MQLSEKKSDNKALYNIVDLCKVLAANNMDYIQIEESKIVYNENLDVSVMLPDDADENLYKLEIYSEDKKTQEINLDNETKSAEILLNESKNNIKVILYRDNQIVEEKEKQIYYIDPYKKQFLDELSKNGVVVHYRNGSMEKYQKDIDLVKKAGINYIRTDFLWRTIDNQNGTFNFSKYDEWIDEAKKLNLKIIAILIPNGTICGEDMKINNQEELNRFVKFVEEVAKKYPQIQEYEVYNEPNLSSPYIGGSPYTTEEYLEWYAKAVEGVKNKLAQINPSINVISGATSVPIVGSSSVMESKEFFDKITEYGAYKSSDAFSYHPYDTAVKPEQNTRLYSVLNTHKEAYNGYGGFIKSYVTEYGVSVIDSTTEEMQSQKDIQQSVILDQSGIKMSILYNFWNMSNSKTVKSANYGLLYNDYLPKPAYYAVKKYYENINGSEYIGTANIIDGLEFHVYDKDGKPKVVAWSNNTNKNITIPYENFTAKDVYGKDIQKDETSNLTITTSPVYLDNISRTYFYQATSNTMKEKFEEFNTKFTEEITKVNGLAEKLEQQKQIVEDIGTRGEENEINEDTSIQLMKDFYGIGNTLIDEYKNGTLDIEPVKLSSMLDALNDIGDSYEDLVTVTAQTREKATIEETGSKIEAAKKEIEASQDLEEIVYPTKMLDFAKDFYEKATYINGLDEENDIKTGLIVSKNLHADLLSDWAKQFADIFIDKYLQENPVGEITYAKADGQPYVSDQLTNQNVIATLPTTEDMQITSEGGNTHTFENNDSFTFTYTRKGRDFEVVATVNNIDKDAPLITGAEDSQKYINAVIKLEVQDANLDKIELYKNEQELGEYTRNEDIPQISESGTYKVVATDKAGNSTTIQFEVVDKKTEYANRVNELLEQYNNFENTYSSQISEINNISSSINNIKQEIQKTIENTRFNKVIEELENTYKLGNSFIESNPDELIEILKGIEIIGQKYKGLIELSEEKTNVNIGDIEKQISTLNDNLNKNTDLDIQGLVELKDTAVGYLNSINESSDYMKKYNLISTQYIKTYIEKILSNMVNKYVNSNPIGDITYSITADKITNKNVIATLPVKDNMQVLTSGGNTHTFTKNGEFKFRYNRRGNEYEAIARVANIDKIPPVIKGIANNRTYTSAISPKVKDDHLDENNIKLYFNNNLKTDYKNGDTISDIGKYKMIAIDQVDNKTEVNFEIKEKIKPNDTNKDIETNVYDIQGSIIKKVTSSTTYEKFRENIQTGLEYEIKRDGDVLAEEDEIATGDILTVNNTNKQYTLIVTGDISSDGRVNSIDLVRIRRFLLNTKQLNNIEKLAADANLDGKNVDISDMVRIRKIILNNI